MTAPFPYQASVLTVGQLMERLRAVPPETIVMLEWDDDNGPAQHDTYVSTAGFFNYPRYWHLINMKRVGELILDERPAFVLTTL